MIHQVTRLHVLAILHRNREVSFARLREMLGLTDGNLGSHAQRLLDAGYIEQRNALCGVRFELRYRLSAKGRAAFQEYVAQIRHLLESESE